MRMSKPYSELQVFSTLDREKISKIIDVLDESIVRDQFNSSKIKDLEKLGLAHEQSRDVLKCFFNFYRGFQHPDKLKKFFNNLDIEDDMKQRIIETFEELREKADKTKVAVAVTSEKSGRFGHDHLHVLEVTSEFRPIASDDKLQKMIMMIIVEGYTQNTAHTKETPINFQIDLKSFEHLVQELNEHLKQINMEVKILQEKLGEDIVSV